METESNVVVSSYTGKNIHATTLRSLRNREVTVDVVLKSGRDLELMCETVVHYMTGLSLEGF
jgi:hypothetical protein